MVRLEYPNEIHAKVSGLWISYLPLREHRIMWPRLSRFDSEMHGIDCARRSPNRLVKACRSRSAAVVGMTKWAN